jgi:hypothetical protein
LIRFFLPESDDLVDPGYDFERDIYSVESVADRQDVYVHEMLPSPPYDGLLVSKSNISIEQEQAIIALGGIHNHLRLPEQYPILGDCGAFQFIGDLKPPYTNEQIFNYYNDLGFDLGITLDHVIVNFDYNYDEEGSLFPQQPSEDMRFRFQLTIDNAKELLRLTKERNARFQPIGSAQGWSPQSYHEAVKKLIEIGYTYIAIGGVARASDQVINSVLDAIRDTVLEADVKLHVLGVARFSLLDVYQKTNVVSCDSAATLMQAFKSTSSNYHATEPPHYTCIRIPPTGENTALAPSPKVNKLLKPLTQAAKAAEKAWSKSREDSNLDQAYRGHTERLSQTRAELAVLEKGALEAVRAYADHRLSLDETMAALIEYEEQFEHNPKLQAQFQKMLEERPWEACSCAICKALGIEVVIMRGNNRNRRRGFHNTFVFYEAFKRRLGRIE